MGSNTKLLFLTLIVIIAVAFAVILSDVHNPISGIPKDSYRPGIFKDVDRAVNQALKVYEQKKNLGEDFSDGPCLTNDLLPGWILDIAHNPRKPVDNLSQNQCQALLEGRAKHFVELDPNGNVIRAL